VVGCRLVVGVFWTLEDAILSRVELSVLDNGLTLWQLVELYLEMVN